MDRVSPPMETAVTAGLRPSKWELALLVLVLAMAVGLRIARPGRMAVEHFDEGVYASNLAAGPYRQFRYPERHLYAPPLLPASVEWSQVLFGRGRLSPLLPNLLAGGLTVLLLWWVARDWFGSAAGLSAAVFAAMSDMHVLYTRTVLTDPLLCFWLLAAVYLAWRCLREPTAVCAVAAGLATSLAWWTKYNGWLPLAIGLSALIAWSLTQRPGWSGVRRRLGGWCVMAAVAFAAWTPVLIDLQPRGGYAAVAANHRGYLVGLENWTAALARQRANLQFYDGWLSRLAPAMALMLAGAIVLSAASRRKGDLPSAAAESARGISDASKPAPPNTAGGGVPLPGEGRFASLPRGLPAAVLIVGGASILAGSTDMLALMAVAGIAVNLRWRPVREQPAAGREHHRNLAAWMLAAWFVGLLVSTPLYREYPRLVLPWLVSSWLGAAALVGWILDRSTQPPADGSPATGRPILSVLGLIVGAAVLPAILFGRSGSVSSRGVPGWQDRTGMQSIAWQVVDAARLDEPADRRNPLQSVFYTYAEPALFFHLSELAAAAVPIGDLSILDEADEAPATARFLLTGPHAHHDEALLSSLERRSQSLELVATFPYAASDLVLLNRYSPRQLAAPAPRPSEEVRLYRVRLAR